MEIIQDRKTKNKWDARRKGIVVFEKKIWN